MWLLLRDKVKSIIWEKAHVVLEMISIVSWIVSTQVHICIVVPWYPWDWFQDPTSTKIWGCSSSLDEIAYCLHASYSHPFICSTNSLQVSSIILLGVSWFRKYLNQLSVISKFPLSLKTTFSFLLGHLWIVLLQRCGRPKRLQVVSRV
jgi:hypothetical protein